MQITEIRIRKVTAEGKLKAYVTVTFDNCFVVHNVKIIEGKTGLFIAMPSRKTSSGDYKDVAHPISLEFRTQLQDRILAEYEAGHIEEGPASADDDSTGRPCRLSRSAANFFIFFGPSASGKPPVFGTGIPLVRIQPVQL